MKREIKPVRSSARIGSSYAGIIRCDFDVLEANLGTPCRVPTSDNKVTCIWDLSLRLESGRWILFTVYNYKDKIPAEEISMWHVGSFHKDDDAIFSFLERILRCDVIRRR